MNILFRAHCDDILREYVYSSVLGKREAERQELLEERMKTDRRILRKRILSLERERVDSDSRIETLAWDLERLHFRLDGFEDRLQQIDGEMKRLSSSHGEVGSEATKTDLEKQLSEDYSKLMESYTQLRSAVICATSLDELGWIQI